MTSQTLHWTMKDFTMYTRYRYWLFRALKTFIDINKFLKGNRPTTPKWIGNGSNAASGGGCIGNLIAWCFWLRNTEKGSWVGVVVYQCVIISSMPSISLICLIYTELISSPRSNVWAHAYFTFEQKLLVQIIIRSIKPICINQSWVVVMHTFCFLEEKAL